MLCMEHNLAKILQEGSEGHLRCPPHPEGRFEIRISANVSTNTKEVLRVLYQAKCSMNYSGMDILDGLGFKAF